MLFFIPINGFARMKDAWDREKTAEEEMGCYSNSSDSRSNPLEHYDLDFDINSYAVNNLSEEVFLSTIFLMTAKILLISVSFMVWSVILILKKMVEFIIMSFKIKYVLTIMNETDKTIHGNTSESSHSGHPLSKIQKTEHGSHIDASMSRKSATSRF